MKSAVVASRLLLLADHPEFARFSVGSSGELIAATPVGEAGFCVISAWEEGGGVRSLQVQAQRATSADRLGSDRWLIVGYRFGQRRASAFIVGSHGERVREFDIGGGLRSVQVARQGAIWVAYHDEGACSDDPISHTGLNCFDEHGSRTFDYTSFSLRYELPEIYDCYALNVASDDEVWASIYCPVTLKTGSFPLVKVVDHQLAGFWPDFPVRGSRTLAVDGDTVVCVGSWADKASVTRVVLSSRQVDELIVVGDDGRSLAFERHQARGSKVYFRTDEAIYRLDIARLRVAS